MNSLYNSVWELKGNRDFIRNYFADINVTRTIKPFDAVSAVLEINNDSCSFSRKNGSQKKTTRLCARDLCVSVILATKKMTGYHIFLCSSSVNLPLSSSSLILTSPGIARYLQYRTLPSLALKCIVS